MAKPIPQDPQPNTLFGASDRQTLRRPNTCPKVLTFGRGKLAPLASGTMTMGCGHRLYLHQPPSKRTSCTCCFPIT